MLGNVAQHLRVVGNTQLVRDRKHDRVGGLDCGIGGEVAGNVGGVTHVTLAKAGEQSVNHADLVLAVRLGTEPEVHVVHVVNHGDDAAADRNAGRKVVAGLRPLVTEQLDLLGLQLVEGNSGVFGEQG